MRWSYKALLIAAAGITAVAAIAGSLLWISNQFDDRFRWRTPEYAKLRHLKAGFDTGMFRQALGPPAFVRRDRGLVERTYRGREYWVQTIERPSGEVLEYAVTSCSEAFRPTFPLGPAGSIKLRRTSMRGAIRSNYPDFTEAVSLDYFLPGATANTKLIEWIYGANPGNYKSFAWGVNDACADFYRTYAPLFSEDSPFQGKYGREYTGSLKDASSGAKRLRSQTRANTYAETAPFIEFSYLLERNFQIGADRILTRTAD